MKERIESAPTPRQKKRYEAARKRRDSRAARAILETAYRTGGICWIK